MLYNIEMLYYYFIMLEPYVYLRLDSQDVECYSGCYIEADGIALLLYL